MKRLMFIPPRSIFQDMVSMDNLIIKVMKFAQSLVGADRASLFMVDSRNKCLSARIFDMNLTDDVPVVTEEIKWVLFLYASLKKS